MATTPYDTARFLAEPISAREILTPEELANDARSHARAQAAFTRAGGLPTDTEELPSLLDEALCGLGGAPVARALDALDAMSVLPSPRFTSKLKAVAALTAARLYALESMAYRTAGAIESAGVDMPLEQALMALPVEYTLTRRYAYENLSDATDRLLNELRKANPYMRVIIRDERPTTIVDRVGIAQTVLDRCGGARDLSLSALTNSAFPALVGRESAEAARPDWVLGQEQMAAESGKLLAARVLTLLRAEEQPLPSQVVDELLDFLIQVYALDSSVVRTVQLLKRRGIEKAKVQCDLTSLQSAESVTAIRNIGRRLLQRCTGARAARDLVAGLQMVSGRDLDGTSERVVAHYVEAGLARG